MNFEQGDVIQHKYDPKIYLIKDYDSDSLEFILKPLYPVPGLRDYVFRLDMALVHQTYKRIIKG